MARLTPHARAQTARPEPTYRRPSTSTAAQRVARLRKEERWADERIARSYDATMRGRYGVRM